MADSKESEITRRFTIEVPLDVYRKIDPHLAWGLKKLLYTKLTSMAAEVIDKHGEVGLHLILSGAFELKLNRKALKDE